jgi:hypothetical protein
MLLEILINSSISKVVGDDSFIDIDIDNDIDSELSVLSVVVLSSSNKTNDSDAGECVKNIIGVLLLVDDVDGVAGDTVSVGVPEGLGEDVGVGGGSGRQLVFAQHDKSSGQSVSKEDTHGE